MLLSLLNDASRASTEQQIARMRGLVIPQRPSIPPETIAAEVAAIRAALSDAHGTRIRFVISTGTPPPEILKGGPRCYTLDSADPEKLKGIIDDMQKRAREPIAKLLPATLVILAGGPTFASEKLAGLYRKFGVDSTANFVTADEERALHYQIALAGKDLKEWVDGEVLSDTDADEALQLAAFLKAQASEHRDKITVLLPDAWSKAGFRTRRALGAMTVLTDEKPNLRNYYKAAEASQDRVFLMVQRKGERHPEADAFKGLRNAGYPIAALTFNATAPLSRYFRFIEYAALALQQSADEQGERNLSEGLGTEIPTEGFRNSAAWKQLHTSPESPRSLADALRSGAGSQAFTYGEIVFFGDLRYSENAPLIRKALDNAARTLFRAPFRIAAEVCEGPAELMDGDGRAFSILILAAAQNRFALADFEPDRHVADFLAALERKHRMARAILVKDLSPDSIAMLEEFFSQTARILSSGMRSEPHG